MSWENISSNLETLSVLLKEVSPNTRLVVLPEMFATGFTMRPDLFSENEEGTICKFLRMQSEYYAIAGSMAFDEGQNYYNRLWVFDKAQVLTHYDKRHLFAFGNENKYYLQGKEKGLFQLGNWNIQPFICYDLRFPVWCRSNKDIHVQIYVANWPEKRIQAWRNLLVARAIENQCYVIGVNRIGEDGNQVIHNGQSMVIDALGNTVLDAKDIEGVFEVELDLWELEKIRRKWPFLNDADKFEITF